MKQLSLAVALLLLAGCASAQRRNVADTWEQEIRAAEARHRLAFLSADTAALREMFSDQFIVNSPLNMVVGKGQLLDMVRSGRLAISTFDQQIDQIRRFGDIAVVMGEDAVTYIAPSPNAGQMHRRRFTDIWQMDKGGWRFIARQATIVRQEGAK